MSKQRLGEFSESYGARRELAWVFNLSYEKAAAPSHMEDQMELRPIELAFFYFYFLANI